MRYKSEDIDLLLQKLHIEEVVGEFVDLKKSGVNFKGLCPFHQDSNPSFIVSPSKNICKCFVCEAGGNPIKFYSEYKKISFIEAVEELSNKYNIKIEKVENNRVNENKEYFDIMENAHNYYKNEIFNSREALEYLNGRKITPKFIKDNGIGFAPNRWTSLYDYLITKGFKKKKIFELGLVKESDKGIYDTFRNRVIFPIYSISGKIIAFGGRSLENNDNIPKYINSQETPIFTKGKNLYGFVNKGSNIKRKNYSIIMEGYMDVLSAHLYGLDVTLAPLGTSLTYEQVNLLKKYTNNVILSFDMDEAGQKATERAIMILKSQNFNIRVVNYQDAKDPDEYLKKYGKEEFLKVIKKSFEVFDYLYFRYSAEYNLDDHMSKQNFIERFKEFFQSLNNELEQELYLDKMSKSLEIEHDILKNILIKNNRKRSRHFYEKEDKKYSLNRKMPDLEKLTLALILSDYNYLTEFKNKNVKHSFTKDILKYLEIIKANNLKTNDIIKEIIKIGELTKDEENELVNISLIVFNDYSDRENIEKGYRVLFTSWFMIEIKEKLKNRNNILEHIKVKKIEDKVKMGINFNELKLLYEEFININT